MDRSAAIDPHGTTAALISASQSCRSDWLTGTEGKTAAAAPVPEQHRVRAETKTEDSEELPPEKQQSKDSDAEPVTQWRAHTAGDEVQGVYRQRAATAKCVNALACH
ncbi:hypothetical protein AQPW35_19060 [Rubrivivax pictus]|uniref:Uncharacterized protein n=1 Tax=Pseudaquabacterium pictum TaxID=2315236 RepID=A0A480ASW3_9BURK|nr:hypothetical protein AQPW35_19060 [Rubrivivax pictus]